MKAPPLEKDIEKAIGAYARSKGCLYYKFTSPNNRSVPDRIIVAPGGAVGFLEVKRAGQCPTKLQTIEINKLKQMGCIVAWVDSVPEGKAFVDKVRLSAGREVSQAARDAWLKTRESEQITVSWSLGKKKNLVSTVQPASEDWLE